MVNTVSISNFCQRNESNFVDLISTLYKMQVKVDLLGELSDFIKLKTDLQQHMRDKGNQKYANSLSKSKLT